MIKIGRKCRGKIFTGISFVVGLLLFSSIYIVINAQNEGNIKKIGIV